MKPGSLKYETARCSFLHGLCQEIEAATAKGSTRKAAIARVARRQRAKLFTRGQLSRERLRVLYDVWRRARSPECFRRHYKPGRPHIPVPLVLEFLNRVAGERVVSAAIAMRSLRNDWQMGIALPGLGTWSDYVRRMRGESAHRITPPAFPFSYRTFCRYLAPGVPETYAKRIVAARRAQRELDRFMNHIEACRREIEARAAHEPIA